MTRDDIIRMARECGFWLDGANQAMPMWVIKQEELERFAALVASAERERILDICKEGLWDAEGIRYHLDNQEMGQA